MTIAKTVIPFIFRNIPLLNSTSGLELIIPYYHLVSDDRIVHVRNLYQYKNRQQFIADLEFLCRKFEPISPHDLVDHVRNGKTLRRASFLLTFDDGYSQNYSIVAPILLQKGIPAIFFLSTDFVNNWSLWYRNKASIIIEEILLKRNLIQMNRQSLPRWLDVPFRDAPQKILSVRYKDAKVLDEIAAACEIDFDEYLKRNQPYLTSEQIRAMLKMGFHFGAHSKDHPFYSDLGIEEQLNQTLESIEFIKREFNPPYSLFSFPHGDSAVGIDFFPSIEKHVDMTFETGVRSVCSVPWNLPRIGFEKGALSAGKIMAYECAKKRIRRFIGQG